VGGTAEGVLEKTTHLILRQIFGNAVKVWDPRHRIRYHKSHHFSRLRLGLVS
jgi:hypothetical protein